jgi:hypothetical protein
MTTHGEEQKLRRETLINDRRVREPLKEPQDIKEGIGEGASTMHQFAISEANQPSGRFAATGKATVVGATPAPTYPAGPNWASDPVPPEPALGFEIDAIEAVGTEQEIEASIRRLRGEDQ